MPGGQGVLSLQCALSGVVHCQQALCLLYTHLLVHAHRCGMCIFSQGPRGDHSDLVFGASFWYIQNLQLAIIHAQHPTYVQRPSTMITVLQSLLFCLQHAQISSLRAILHVSQTTRGVIANPTTFAELRVGVENGGRCTVPASPSSVFNSFTTEPRSCNRSSRQQQI